MRGRPLAGALLVGIGVALLIINLTGIGGVAVVLLGGLAFLATHLATGSYGFLVPGGILTGFGAALVVEDLGLVTDIGLFGLGGGFLLILLVQLLTGAPREGGWWWPSIPGGILIALGAIEYLQGDAAGLILPGVLIILGLAFLLNAARRRPEEGTEGVDGGRTTSDDGPTAPQADAGADPDDGSRHVPEAGRGPGPPTRGPDSAESR
jgi:hypothetical protein